MRGLRYPHAARIAASGAGTLLIALMPAAVAQQTRPASVPQADTCTVDADGTAHITRVIPVPGTISPEAQKFISRGGPSGPEPTLAERRAHTDAFRIGSAAEARKLYPVDVESKTIGGVQCDVITPPKIQSAGRVLINVHGGGFNSDSGSLVEGIPIASLAHTTVVSVYYRLAPEHPFPAAVDDTVAVYKELLKTYKPEQMGLFGTSAGAILTAEVAAALRRANLPLPAALGIFSGTGDLSQPGDSQALYSVQGLGGILRPPSKGLHDTSYIGTTDPKDPVLSPLYADLRGFPPTLFVTSTRDLLLSGTTILHRAFLRAGVDAQLVVFEALPHAFWYDYHLPETQEALDVMAKFFDAKLGE
ncbi:MAG TPA: alpha/beta hydrolase fold domain-containing protein [Terriglobia bacterium]|nr:alpha/beta hydrolase fold domain-containing protein [Terriglobia bacterium]